MKTYPRWLCGTLGCKGHGNPDTRCSDYPYPWPPPRREEEIDKMKFQVKTGTPPKDGGATILAKVSLDGFLLGLLDNPQLIDKALAPVIQELREAVSKAAKGAVGEKPVE